MSLDNRKREILSKAYPDNQEDISRYKEFRTGRSGAETYLIQPAKKLVIAKFDNPFALKPEEEAYNSYVADLPQQFRAFLEHRIIESEDSEMGVLLYSFQGNHETGSVQSLLDYCQLSTTEGNDVVKIIETLNNAVLTRWYNQAVVSERYCYASAYDRLLPVHVVLEKTNDLELVTSWNAEQVNYKNARNVSVGDSIELSNFKITSTRNNLLRLQQDRSGNINLPPVRAYLTGDWAQTQPFKWGDSYTFAGRVTKTRRELLYEFAEGAECEFDQEEGIFRINDMTYHDPLPYVDLFLDYEDSIRTSVVHGDLNLNNIIVSHDAPFLIDFADTKAERPIVFDFQRLEDHVIAEILAPALEEQNLSANVFGEILLAINNQEVLADNNEELLANLPFIDQLRELYEILLTIRGLARQHLHPVDNWSQYYRGLFLVFAGALKYPRSPFQKQLLLVGMAMLKAQIDGAQKKDYTILGETDVSRTEIPSNTPWYKQKYFKILATIIPLLAFLGGVYFAAVISHQSDDSFIKSQIFGTPSEHWPPINGTILERVRERTYLVCGVSGTLNGFSKVSGEEDDNGYYENADGIDADFCRAIAIAAFGKEYKRDRVRFLRTTTNIDEATSKIPERFAAIRDGIVDVLVRNSTHTMSRDANGVTVGPTIFHDTQKFMVHKDSEIKNVPQDLEGKNICVLKGTTSQNNVKNLKAIPVIRTVGGDFKNNEDVVNALTGNDVCDAATSDESQLIARKAQLGNSKDDYMILPEEGWGISYEPLAVFMPEGDSQWHDIVSAAVYAPIYAEQIGLSSDNIAEQRDLADLTIKEFLGMNDECINKHMGELLAIDKTFADIIIDELGNYNEIFERNLDGLISQRGLNQLSFDPKNNDNSGTSVGKLYTPKFDSIRNPSCD